MWYMLLLLLPLLLLLLMLFWCTWAIGYNNGRLMIMSNQPEEAFDKSRKKDVIDLMIAIQMANTWWVIIKMKGDADIDLLKPTKERWTWKRPGVFLSQGQCGFFSHRSWSHGDSCYKPSILAFTTHVLSISWQPSMVKI